MGGNVRLTATKPEATEDAIDLLSYIEPISSSDGFLDSGASYQATCQLPSEQIDELIAAARIGRLPASFDISVEGPGIEYGWEPDGSGMEWDNKNHNHLATYLTSQWISPMYL